MKRFEIYFALKLFFLINSLPWFCFFHWMQTSEVEMRIHSECAFVNRNFWETRFQSGAEYDWCGPGSFSVFQVYYLAGDLHASSVIVLGNRDEFSETGCCWCWCSRCRCFGSFGLSGKMFFFSGEIRKVVFVLGHYFIFCHPIFSLARLLLVFL